MSCGSRIDKIDFYLHRHDFNAVKLLRNNESIVIYKTEKGSGVVILNMTHILNDTSKFTCPGNVDEWEKIAIQEQRRLLQFY